MSWTLCTSGAAIAKAGVNANSTIIASNATLAEWSDEAEGSINLISHKDWIANYAGIGANFKPILADCASDIIAKRIIAYDMSGYTSRAEAQTMLDVIEDNLVKNIAALKETKATDLMI